MPVAVKLGEGSGDLSLTVPVGVACPGAGTIHAVCAFVQNNTPSAFMEFDETTDTQGGSWVEASSTAPIIGLSGLGTGENVAIHVGSCARSCIANSLTATDEVTVTFIPDGFDDTEYLTACVLIYIPAVFLGGGVGMSNISEDNPVYDVGLGWEGNGQSDALLSYPFSAIDAPIVDDEAIIIAGYGSFPPADTTALELANVGTSEGYVGVTAAVGHYNASEEFDPGASFTTGSITACNFQAQAPTVPGEDVIVPPPDPATLPGKYAYYHNGEWHIQKDLSV